MALHTLGDPPATRRPYGLDVDSTTQPQTQPQPPARTQPLAHGGKTLTEVVLGEAGRRGDKPALVDRGGGVVFTYRALAATVAGVAAGLVRRGARPGQGCAVHADTASTLFVAAHAALAAGALVAPIPFATPAEVGEHLCRTGARSLFTTTTLAGVAVAAAERSRVRQVLCFGPAPDTTDVADLVVEEATSLCVQPSGRATALL